MQRLKPGSLCDCHGPQVGNTRYQLSFGEVKKFTPTRVTYSASKGPYLLPVGDEAMKLADRLENAKTVESKEAAALRYESLRPMVLNKYGFLQPTTQRVEGAFGKGTRKQARAMAKLVADNRHMVGVAFQSRRPRKLGVGTEVCCESHGCSYTYGVATDEGPGMDRTVYFRTWFHTLSESKRREFLSRQLKTANHHNVCGCWKHPLKCKNMYAPRRIRTSRWPTLTWCLCALISYAMPSVYPRTSSFNLPSNLQCFKQACPVLP